MRGWHIRPKFGVTAATAYLTLGAAKPHYSMGNFDAFESKMTAAGMGSAPIRAFRRNYEALLRNESGLIADRPWIFFR